MIREKINTQKYLLITILLSLAGLAHGEEGKLGVSFDVTFMSKLMDKGSEYYGQQSAIMETIAIELWDTGFGVAVANRKAKVEGV